MTLTLPELAPPGQLRLPEWAERELPGGLTVIVVRRPSVPLVELRLRIPFGETPLAASEVLAETVLSGTDIMSNLDIAARLQEIGGNLATNVDRDRLLVSGNGLVAGLPRLLELLAQVLTGASYPATEVATERERLADRIRVARSQPSFLARTALLRRMYGDHPYAVQTSDPAAVLDVDRDALSQLHHNRVRPTGATLVLVGDLDPDAALETAAEELSGWGGGPDSSGAPVALPPTPPLEPGPLVLADRPDSVQSSLRLALPAVARTHPDHPALQLANLVFGGYFSSRWVENIREDKGYTYGPHSAVEHPVAGSTLVVAADVATEVTAPALLETWYELGRLASAPPSPEELEQARQYALGTLRLSMSTQAGLAGLTSTYAGFGLRLDYLARHSEAIAAATADDVAAAAATYLAPARVAGVVLGDADRVEPALDRLLPVTRWPELTAAAAGSDGSSGSAGSAEDASR